MNVYRLCKVKYVHDLSGKGAETSSGRWNSKRVPIVYTSQSKALCASEIAAHTPLGNLPADYCLVTIQIPDDSIKQYHTTLMPKDWRAYPHPDFTQKIGDHFIAEGKLLAFKVPSAVIPGDFNFLLNPQHNRISEVVIKKVESFKF